MVPMRSGPYDPHSTWTTFVPFCNVVPPSPVANIPGTTWITLQVVIQDWILTQRLHPAQQDHWSIQTGPTMSRPSLISPLMPFRNLCCSKPLRDQRETPYRPTASIPPPFHHTTSIP